MAEVIARIVSCPTCGIQVPWDPASRYRPFCSRRCRTIDLGQWAMEHYRIPNAADPDDSGAADENEVR